MMEEDLCDALDRVQDELEAGRLSLDDAVARMRGGDGWEKSGGCEDYQEAGRRLVSLGLSEVEAFDLLLDLFSAAAGEFGC
jgi:hypothetical protein